MYYIFSADGKLVATADFEPNSDDLATRGEQAVKSDQIFANPILIDGVIVEQIPSIFIEERRQQVRNAINALRDRKINGGVYVPEIDKWIDSDERAERNLLSTKASLDLFGDTLDIVWTCADNTTIKLDKATMLHIWQALMTNKQQNHANALAHKAAVEKSENPLEYDYSGGWTQTYEDNQNA